MPEQTGPTQAVQAVGIDLGTTYSVVSHLNESGEPVTIPNQEGELATPSVVLFEGEQPIVGTEALRNSIRFPDRVVENSKRFMGDVGKRWWINGRPYGPVDIATLILKKLVSAAQEKIGQISQAVITVPAQFSDAQRHATIQAGHAAGLERVDVINEPVAAALCYVLGSEGLWFSELAGEQRILVYDLGGGTFDLSLVRYRQDEVTVIASSGDLHLGGINWNEALVDAIAGQFAKSFRDDPRTNPESLQAFGARSRAGEARSVRSSPRGIDLQPRRPPQNVPGGTRAVSAVDQAARRSHRRNHAQAAQGQQARLGPRRRGAGHGRRLPHADDPRAAQATKRPHAEYHALAGPVDCPRRDVLRRHAARERQVRALDPHGGCQPSAGEGQAAKRQRAAKLGILIRDMKTQTRVPHYLIPANTPLPTESTQQFGTVVENQRRVHLVIVESGTSPDQPYVVLGDCRVDGLPPNLPEGSKIDVTISYDPQATVHVSAKDAASGKSAHTEILRQENIVAQLTSDPRVSSSDSVVLAEANPNPFKKTGPGTTGVRIPDLANDRWEAFFDQTPSKPIPQCHECGRPLDEKGICPTCAAAALAKSKPAPAAKSPLAKSPVAKSPADRTPIRPQPGARAAGVKPAPKPPTQEMLKPPSAQPPRKPPSPERPKRKPSSAPQDEGEDEFWKYVGE